MVPRVAGPGDSEDVRQAKEAFLVGLAQVQELLGVSSALEELPTKSCMVYLEALGLLKSRSQEGIGDVKQAKAGFFAGLTRVQELLGDHLEINSSHVECADVLRNADLQQAKGLAKHLTRAPISCPSCQATFLVSVDAAGRTAPCPKCDGQLVASEDVFNAGVTAARQLSDDAERPSQRRRDEDNWPIVPAIHAVHKVWGVTDDRPSVIAKWLHRDGLI
jgi:Zn finger protein HypA/HybF involved in hydrogenase expression